MVDAHARHASTGLDLQRLQRLRKSNMRRSGCSAAIDRISDDDFAGNSARSRHDSHRAAKQGRWLNAKT
jgi:hypothetical protein